MAPFPQMAPAGFVTAPGYPAGIAPASVAVGDFNGDGIADLAVVGNPSDANLTPALSVLLGNGDGSFGARQHYSVGFNPQALALGDFNGDGNLDIVVSNFGDGTLSLWFGKGDGTFHSPRTYYVGGRPTGLAAADFNGDGLLDLAVVNYNGPGDAGTVTVWFGNGDGTFGASHNLVVGVQPWSVVVGDFNGDGILDLAVTNSNWSQLAQGGSVSILLGEGDGTFQAAQNYPVGDDPRALVVGDFNGDGYLDLAVSNIHDWTLNVLLGNGDGTFGAALSYPSAPAAYDSTGYFYTLAVADFNGDGIWTWP